MHTHKYTLQFNVSSNMIIYIPMYIILILISNALYIQYVILLIVINFNLKNLNFKNNKSNVYNINLNFKSIV
jgi:hypothetical protein